MGKCLEVALGAAALVWLSVGTALADCAVGKIELAGDRGRVSFDVTVADDDDERARGLMHVAEMPETEGMLFIYDHPQPVAFWMLNTLIPLDMIFIDRRGVVKKVHANAVPHDRTAIPSEVPVLSVLEINGGLAARMGIRPGTLVRHAELPQENVAWAC